MYSRNNDAIDARAKTQETKKQYDTCEGAGSEHVLKE